MRSRPFVELRFNGSIKLGDIDRSIADVPEPVEAFTRAGDPDALALIGVNDLDHLKRVTDRISRTGRVTGTKNLRSRQNLARRWQAQRARCSRILKHELPERRTRFGQCAVADRESTGEPDEPVDRPRVFERPHDRPCLFKS